MGENKNSNIEWAAPQEKGIMRHRSVLAWIAVATIVVLSVFAGLNLTSHDDSGTVPEGIYGIKDLEYLTPISSSTPGYFLENNKGTTFTFYDSEFYVSSEGAAESSILTETFSDVTYERISMGKVLNLTEGVNDGLDLSKFTKKKGFRIFSKGVDTGYTIYRLDNEIWLSYIHPASKLKYVEYLFSLKVDELQNQSAAEILSIMIAADFPIKELVVITEQNDPSGLLGTPNGYICKAEWTDTRGVNSLRSSVFLEVFQTRADCEQRTVSLEKLYSYISSDGYNYFSEGNVLIYVQKGITDTQAAIYGEALEAIRKGEMPQY